MNKNAKNIKIGIAFEGLRDIKPLEILIERIIFPQYSPIFTKEVTPHTGLIGFIKPYIKRFFEQGEPVDLAVFVTDQDKQTKSVKRVIQKKIEETNVTYKPFSVIGVPIPHFEGWLLADQGYIKSYFSLPGEKTLPNIDNSPKFTLEYLQRNMKDPKASLVQIYQDLASSINLDTTCDLRKDFKAFANQLLSSCKQIT